MVTRRKKAIEFPPETCGSCQYYEAKISEQSLCWGSPPILADDLWIRGTPTDAINTACWHYKPKQNG
jgi:hypothetical protein